MPTTTENPSRATVQNPRRLLILSPTSHSQTVIPHILHSLTGSPIVDPPTQASDTDTPSTTYAGYTSHPPLQIENKYYKAEVPIWVDSIPLASEATKPDSAQPAPEDGQKPPDATPQQWSEEFSGPDAQCVREAIGAMIMCVHNFEAPPPESAVGSISERRDVSEVKEWLKAVGSVRELIEEERGGLEVPGVVVLVGKSERPSVTPGEDVDDYNDVSALDDERPFSVAWWEDQLCEMGMLGVEVVSWDPREAETQTKNQFGEFQGMRRIREVLETHDWTPDSGASGLDNDEYAGILEELKEGSEDNTFGLEVAQVEREMMGLRFALERGGDGYTEDVDDVDDQEHDVEQLESLMRRLQAMRDMSDGLPENDRKRFAAQTIRDLMKEMEL